MKLTKEQLEGIEGTFEYFDALEAEDIVRNQRMLLDHIQALETEMQWRKVEPGNMPEYDIPVLVKSADWPDSISAACLVYEDGWLWAGFNGLGDLTDPTNYELDDDYQYTHWKPIAPPDR